MRKIILTSAIFCLILVYSASEKEAYSNSGNPPSGRTGQSAGGTCANGGCHTGGSIGLETIGTNLLLEFFDANGSPVTSYIPGQQYTVSVDFISNFSTYGFALSSDGNADQFIAGAGTSFVSTGSVPQIEHSGTNTSGQWQFNWLAPTTAEGDITFYLGAIGGNGNSSTSGDTGFEGTVTLAAAPVVSAAPFEARILFEGPYIGNGMMSNVLQSKGLLPTSQPFSGPPWFYSGTEVLSNTTSAITDWVLLDFYEAGDLSNPVLRTAAILKTDGSIADVDGNAGVSVSSLSQNVDYRVIARSRNHLDLLTSADLSFPLGGAYDFSDPASVAGTNQLKLSADGYHLCRAGDFDGDGACTFQDYNLALSEASEINSYVLYDCNLDGHGTVLDFNLYKSNFDALGVPAVRY